MTTHALRRHPVALVAMLGLVWSSPTLAQTRLYLLTSGDLAWQCNPSCDPGRVIQIDVDRREITASTQIRHARSRGIGPRVTPDGRFLLWSGSEQADYGGLSQQLFVSLFDITRQQQSILFTAASDRTDFVPFRVHPSEMRAFLQLSPFGPVTVAEPDQTRTLPLPPCTGPRFANRSGDGSRLSYHCDQPRSVMVVDSGDGRLLATVPLGASAFTIGATSHVLDGAGTTMYAVDWDNAFEGDPVLYRRFDVATGALLAERRGSTNGIHMWAFNEMIGHLYAGTWAGILVIDATTLTEIGWIGGPLPAVIPKMALDPEQPHAYIAWGRDIGGALRVSLVHTGTLATLGSVEIPIDGAVVGMALGPRPPRLSDLQVGVLGSLATLTWTIAASRSIATEQVVEVGFAPGQTVARLAVAAGATGLTVPGVPPGRYYVRIRSVNGTGLGTPSNEVLVDVP